MNEIYEKLLKCYDIVREKVDFKPEIALVLGSGLGNFADEIDVAYELDYHDIEGFPVSISILRSAAICSKVKIRISIDQKGRSSSSVISSNFGASPPNEEFSP